MLDYISKVEQKILDSKLFWKNLTYFFKIFKNIPKIGQILNLIYLILQNIY